MKKIYSMENLDCANCAAKMERSIFKIKGVKSASINFLAQKLVLEAEDENFDAILKQVSDAISHVEADCHLIL